MGGYMTLSPGLAILCCAMVELDMQHGPKGLIGTVVRSMDDVFGICAVGSSAEEQLVMGHYGRIAVGYSRGSRIGPLKGAFFEAHWRLVFGFSSLF